MPNMTAETDVFARADFENLKMKALEGANTEARVQVRGCLLLVSHHPPSCAFQIQKPIIKTDTLHRPSLLGFGIYSAMSNLQAVKLL